MKTERKMLRYKCTVNGLFGFGEEYGWRGWLADELRPLGPVVANLVTGVLWGLWHTPLILLTKAEIIRQGLALKVDYSLTHSCYDPLPEGSSCGECDSCQIRLKGFRDAGSVDAISYQK